MLINWIRHTKSKSELFLYTRNLENERLKSVFEYKITSWICVLALQFHIGYCVLKKLVWNVRIKAFTYTNIIHWYDIYQVWLIFLLCRVTEIFSYFENCVQRDKYWMIFPILKYEVSGFFKMYTKRVGIF